MFARNGTTITTHADIEITGLELGTQCAKRLLRGYDKTAIQPDKSKAAVIGAYHGQLDEYVDEHQLTSDEEYRYRVGFSRGLATQLLNPDARIDTRKVSPL